MYLDDWSIHLQCFNAISDASREWHAGRLLTEIHWNKDTDADKFPSVMPGVINCPCFNVNCD